MKALTVKELQFIEHQDNIWISGIEICKKLSYSQPRAQAAKIWKRHEKILKQHSFATNLVAEGTASRITRIYDEHGARFFITKCNKPLADQMTMEMINGFIYLRDNRHSWEALRAKNITTRKIATDGIQLLVEYARANGSSNAKKYYMNITKMLNKILFDIDKAPKGFRDTLDESQLSRLTMAEASISEIIKLGIAGGLYYKEIFQDIKKKMTAFAEFMGVVLFDDQKFLN
jgi:hypothetical protein